MLCLPECILFANFKRLVFISPTRIHSSRMRTVRCSSHPGRGGRVSAQGGVYPGGVSPVGRCLPRGVSAWQGVYTSSPCGQTDTCENITFPQLLLRTVITTKYKHVSSVGNTKLTGADPGGTNLLFGQMFLETT